MTTTTALRFPHLPNVEIVDGKFGRAGSFLASRTIALPSSIPKEFLQALPGCAAKDDRACPPSWGVQELMVLLLPIVHL